MSASSDGAITAIRNVRAALDTLGGALAEANLERLLRVESVLQEAVSRLAAHPVSLPEDRHAMAAELAAMTGSLARCRLLGQALTDAMAIFAQARGDTGNYDRDGRERTSATGARRSLEARV